MKVYPKNLYEKLEFDKIRELIQNECKSELGKELVNNLEPSTDFKLIKLKLKQTAEFKELLMFDSAFPSENFHDLKEELKLLEVKNAVLHEHQFLKIKQFLETTLAAFKYLTKTAEKYPTLNSLVKYLPYEKEILANINQIIEVDGTVKPNASKELVSITKSINQLNGDLNRQFKSILTNYKKAGVLSDEPETIRSGRRVLSIPAEYKRKVGGITHDISSTGKTVFIEPAAIVEINNKIVEFEIEKKREINRLLKELTQTTSTYLPQLKAYQTILQLLDFIRAKAKVAIKLDATYPIVQEELMLDLKNGYHPLLYLQNNRAKKRTIPLFIHLNNEDRILLISGPNAGGKSVSLKTVGLLQVMLQSGMLVPCDENSRFGIFKHFHCDIGDEQSLENDLSTYSSRLKNMNNLAANVSKNSLILLDEFGTGTDPSFGGAIAEAVLEFINAKKCFGVVTTHYSNLKLYATETKGIINGAMAFDKENLQPLYDLQIGKPGSSYAFEMAQKNGLHPEILNSAKNKIGKSRSDFEKYLGSFQMEQKVLKNSKAAVVEKEGQLKKQLDHYRRLSEKLEKSSKKLLLEQKEKNLRQANEVHQKLDQLINEWQKSKNKEEASKKIRDAIKKEKQALNNEIEQTKDEVFEPQQDVEITPGLTVKLRGREETGNVVVIRGKNAVVVFGVLRTVVKLKELIVVEDEQKKDVSRTEAFDIIAKTSEFNETLDLRGFRREEALMELQNLLDDALIANAEKLWILHGHGDGILKKAVRNYLKSYKEVKHFEYAHPNQGGQGVTIVEL